MQLCEGGTGASPVHLYNQASDLEVSAKTKRGSQRLCIELSIRTEFRNVGFICSHETELRSVVSRRNGMQQVLRIKKDG